MEKGKRSPLKNNHLRVPGQSLNDQINKLVSGDVTFYVLVVVLCVVLVVLDLWFFFAEISLPPGYITALAVLVTGSSIQKLIGLKKRIESFKLGKEGEIEVGQYLETLREKGYRIYHDLQGDNFNLDHVIVCEHGIFIIETKTRAKPKKGIHNIVFTENEIIIDGLNTGKTIIDQANAQAKWFQTVLKNTTGKSFFVKSIVVFPGWYVESKQGHRKSNLWVLNPEGLPVFIGNLPKVLSDQDMMLVSFHICRFVRADYRKSL